jgi:integrase
MASDLSVWVIRYPDRPHFTMRYVDPITGRQCARSTGTNVRREAERLAAKWEAELREGKYQPPSKIDWTEFRERYEQEKGAALANNTLSAAISAFNHLERVINPKRLESLSSSVLSQFQAKLRQEGMKDSTIATHLRHLRAGLTWAKSMGLIVKVPDFHMPRRPRGQTLMRGRPITPTEFKQMLSIVTDVRPHDADNWKRHLEGLWLSGLRLDESLQLSWDIESVFAIDLSGRHPRFRIYAEAEKGRKDRLLPMTPDFAEFLLRTPREERKGFVFSLKGLCTGEQMTSGRAGRVISDIGETADVIVNKAEGKYATAHDLRRSFGTRWASRVKPATLQLLMRHRTVETTMKYYVSQNADDIADELWEEYGPSAQHKAS